MEFALYLLAAFLGGYVVGRMAGHWGKAHISPLWRKGMRPYLWNDATPEEVDAYMGLFEDEAHIEAQAHNAPASREAHDGPPGYVIEERTDEAPSREALIEALRARREA